MNGLTFGLPLVGFIVCAILLAREFDRMEDTMQSDYEVSQVLRSIEDEKLGRHTSPDEKWEFLGDEDEEDEWEFEADEDEEDE